MPGIQQFVCLDTAFHRDMPDVAKQLALPGEVRRRGVERYGFHGLSLESILHQLERVPDKLVIAHLGNGSSITAIRNGKSIDTTMGYDAHRRRHDGHAVRRSGSGRGDFSHAKRL